MARAKNFCILRTRKLKADGNVGASLDHAFRLRETPNADAKRTPQNQHLLSGSKAEAMARYRAALPEKIRKNGVRCIEYLVTASPEALAKMKPQEKADYFNGAMRWLLERHGKNLFYAGIHIDEKTLHLYAYAVPIDERGKLNCRSFLGGRGKLSAMQDSFYEEVGRPAGLDRGLRGSRARHQTLKQYYGKISSLDAAIAPPRRQMFENEEKYAERYKAQIRPLVARSAETETIAQRNAQLEGYMLEAKRGFNSSTSIEEGLTEEQKIQVRALAHQLREANRGQKRKPRERGNDLGR